MNHFSRECPFLYRWTSETRVLIILCAQNLSVTASGGFQQAEVCCVYISCTIICTSAYTRTHLLVWQWLSSTYLPTQLFNTESEFMLTPSIPVHRTAHLGLPSPLCIQGFSPLTAGSLHSLHSVFTSLLNIAILIQKCYFIWKKKTLLFNLCLL